jgi:hypothetical protein
MSALIRLHRPSIALPALAALAIVASLALAAHSATAQSATGTVTGRVLWGSCVRGIPLPMTPEGQGQVQPMTPEGQGQAQPTTPGIADQAPGPNRPIPAPINGLPAGAVLVAAQNTAISARTDEAGKFTLSGIPAGQYLTVAAGPVANSVNATAERPNVFVNGGQSVDIGTLALGGPSPFGIACRLPLGVPDATPGEAPTPAAP